MTNPPDIDQSGNPIPRDPRYYGPTVGWRLEPNSDLFSEVAANVKNYNASGSDQTTTGSMGLSTTLILANAKDFVNDQGILVFGAGPLPTVGVPNPAFNGPVNSPGGATTYAYRIASLDNQGGISAASAPFTNAFGPATLGTYLSGTGGISMMQVEWTIGTGSPLATIIWRSKSGGTYELLGCFTGTAIYDTGLPTQVILGIPTLPPDAAVAGWLATTIVLGGSTTTLTLGDMAQTSVTGAVVQHDDTAAIYAAEADGNTALFFPAGTYKVRGLALTVSSMIGAGRGVSTIEPYAQTIDGLLSGVSVVHNFDATFTMSGLNITVPNEMAFVAFTIVDSNNPIISNCEFAGADGLVMSGCVNPTATGNYISGWWNRGILVDTGFNNSNVTNNIIGAISGQCGALALTATLAGSLYQWATGIITYNGFAPYIAHNIVTPYGGSFGIISLDPNAVIENNVVKYTGREGIGYSGFRGTGFRCCGNYLYWEPNGAGNQSSYDYGMSATDNGTVDIENGTITGNTIINSAFSAIAVVGSGSVTKFMRKINITVNTIIGVNQLSVHTGGIELSGSNVTKVIVGPNTFINPVNTTTLITEINTGNGVPDGNIIDVQLCDEAVVIVDYSIFINSIYLGGFKTYVPTVVCGQATGTAVGTASGRYRRQGNQVWLEIVVTISGTFTVGVLTSISLPLDAINQVGSWNFVGRENVTSGAAWIGTIAQNASTLTATNYNNSNTILTTQQITLSGWYETDAP